MAVAHQNSTSGNTGASAAGGVTVTVPTVTDGASIMVTAIIIDGGSGVTMTTPTGWTLIRSDNLTTVTQLNTYWKLADREPASYAFNLTSGTKMISWACGSYTGADTTNPIDSSGNTQNNTASASITAPAVTPSCAGGLILRVHGGRNTTGTTTQTPPAASTERQDTSTTATPFVFLTLGETTAQQAEPVLITATAVNTASNTSSRNADTIILRAAPSTSGPSIDVVTLDQTGNGVTPTFSTYYTNEYLIAFLGSDGAGLASTLTASGGGLTWSRLVQESVAGLNTEIWGAQATSKLSAQAITVTGTQAGEVFSIAVVSFINCGGVGATNKGTANPGTPSLAVTTTKPNSWVWGVVFNAINNTAPTAGASQTINTQFRPTGEECWTQRQNAFTAASGTAVTTSVTAPTALAYSMCVVEVLGAPIMRTLNIGQAVNRSNTF